MIAHHQTDRGDGAKASLLCLLGQFVLVGLVTVTPWLFGGVLAAVQTWLFVGVLVALGCWFLAVFGRRAAIPALPVALVPLICALGLGVFQLVPLPAKAHAFFSPIGAELREALESRGPSSDASLVAHLGLPRMAARQPLSLYPASTRSDLALLVLATTVFLLGAALFSTPRSQIWLCGLIAVNGAALAFFSLIHRLTWSDLLYWKVPLAQGRAPFGPFVNQNNAGGFLNLSLAGAVGLTVWMAGRSSSSDSALRGFQRFGQGPSLRHRRARLLDSFAHLSATQLTVLGMAGCIIAGVFCSLSRGAGIAMAGATILTVLVLLCARRRTLRSWCMAAVAMAGVGLVAWIGMRDTVYARFATLLDREILSHSLIPHWRVALRAVPDFWGLGSGLGTYRYVYGLYGHEPCHAWFYHAENQYLESMLVGGFLGLGLMLTMIVLVGRAGWRLLREDSDARTFAFGIAGMFALSGQAIHSFFDFGLYIPANMILLALLCGAMAGGAAQLPPKGWAGGLLALPRSRLLCSALATVFIAAGIWAGLETRSLAAMEGALRDAKHPQAVPRPSPDDLAPPLERLEGALDRRPDDAEAHLAAAKLWVDLYRVRAVEQLAAETGLGTSDRRLWEATSPMVLHARAHEFAREDRIADLERLRSEPVVQENLDEALRHLALARRCCPLLPEVHLIMAQLCVLAVDPAEDQIHIDRARRTAPANPHLLFRCGLLDFRAGRLDRAYRSWRRSLTHSSGYLNDILATVDQQLKKPGMVRKLLPDSPELLVRLARERYASEGQAEIRRLLVRRAEELVDQIELPEDQRHHLRGSILALKEIYPEAIKNYSRAVELRPGEVAWRYEFALLLKQEGLLEEAHRQAKRCARTAPSRIRYRKLLEQIHEARLKGPGRQK